jgi:hypothetical protein
LNALVSLASNHDFVNIIHAFTFKSSHVKRADFINTFFSKSLLVNQLNVKLSWLYLIDFSASLIMLVIICTLAIGNFQIAVSHDNIKQSVFCITELNTSEDSARVGKGFSIIVSSK